MRARAPTATVLPIVVGVVASIGMTDPADAEEPVASLPARVTVVRPDCPTTEAPPAVDAEELARLLRVELFEDGVTDVVTTAMEPREAELATGPRIVPGSLAILTLEGACGDSAEITVVLDDAATVKALRRRVELGSGPPDARVRALAISVAELLRASWLELMMADAPEPLVAVPDSVTTAAKVRAAAALSRELALAEPARPAPPDAEAKPAREAPGFVSVGVTGRGFFRDDVGMAGGRIGISVPAHWVFRANLGAGAWQGSGGHELGQVSMWMVSGRGGVSAAGGGDDWMLEVGPEIEVGWAHAIGSPRQVVVEAGEGSAMVSVLEIVAAGHLRLHEEWWATVDVGAGQTLSTLDALADGERATGLGGATAAIRLSVEVEL